MGYVALYWGFMLLGYFFGSKLRKHQEKLGFINGVMLVCISLLVLLMGIRCLLYTSRRETCRSCRKRSSTASTGPSKALKRKRASAAATSIR